MVKRLISILFPFRGLPRSIYILFFARVVNRAGDFVHFFMTLYVTRVLGFTVQQAGYVLTAVALAMLIGGLFSGKVADSWGRKRVMLWSQGLSASVLFLCGFFSDATWLPWMLVLSQFFMGAVRPASQALVTDLSPPNLRREAFGLLYFGINLGVAIGPLVAGFLFEKYRSWLFWGDSITTFVALILVAIFVEEPDSDVPVQGSSWEHKDDSSLFQAFFGRKILVVFLAATVVSHFVYAQVGFSLPLLMETLFDAKSAQVFGSIMTLNALIVILITPLCLKGLHRFQTAHNMVAGALFYVVGFGVLAVIPPSLAWVFASTIFWTVGEVIFATNARVFSASHTPVNHRGRFASIEEATRSGGRIVAPMIAGLLTGVLGTRGVWIPVAGAALILAGVLFLIARWNQRLMNSSKES
ncbi:MAG: MFS transporter [Spirochaetales bacterium]|nr:MFS transporter [Spirochaetales bacterium]